MLDDEKAKKRQREKLFFANFLFTEPKEMEKERSKERGNFVSPPLKKLNTLRTPFFPTSHVFFFGRLGFWLNQAERFITVDNNNDDDVNSFQFAWFYINHRNGIKFCGEKMKILFFLQKCLQYIASISFSFFAFALSAHNGQRDNDEKIKKVSQRKRRDSFTFCQSVPYTSSEHGSYQRFKILFEIYAEERNPFYNVTHGLIKLLSYRRTLNMANTGQSRFIDQWMYVPIMWLLYTSVDLRWC